MGLVPFILSLSTQRQQVTPEPEPEIDLVLSDDYLEFTGTELRMDFGTTSVNTSLYYRPRMVHHSGKTYFVYSDRDSVLPWQVTRLLVFDNQRGFDVPRAIGRGRSGEETHSVPAIVVDNYVYSIQEDLHDSPLRVLKSADNYDYGFFSLPFSIGTVLSYAHFIKKADGNWMVWSRGIAAPNTGYYSLHITEASAGFETWGTQRRVSSRPTGDDPFLRHYPFLPWGRVVADDKIFLLFSARNDDNVANYRHHVLTTPHSGEDCGRVFSNVEGTFSHDFDVSGVFSDAVAAANFAFWVGDADNIQGFAPVVGIGPEGQVYTVVPSTDGTAPFYFKYFVSGEGWTSKEILIGSLEETLVTASPFDYLTAYSHDDIRMVVRLQIGADVRPYWFKTTNQGDTWQNLGDMRPSFTGTIYPLLPENFLEIDDNENFAILFSKSDSVYTGGAMLHCTVAAKGEIQSIPGVDVEPAASMNYGSTGLFAYEHTASKLTLSGSNVTAKLDQFGSRNATGVNNPQFSVDHITTNGTNQRFTFSVTGIASLTSLVYMVVARAVSGQLSLLLDLSDNTSTSEYIEFQISATGFPTIRNANSITVLIASTESIDDGQDHVITYIMTGRNAYIRVDGKLMLTTSTANTAPHLLIEGVGPNTITTVNTGTIGLRDGSGTDVFGQNRTKAEYLFNGVMPTSEIMAREKKLCNDHGITFIDQFVKPT